MSGEQNIGSVAAATDSLPYLCGKHQFQLTHVLRGGAGWCASCYLFVQSANHAEPLRPTPRPSAKVLAKMKTASKRRTAGKKSTRSSKVRIIAA